MSKELPVTIINDNLGAQYHNYLLSIILTKAQNKYYIYNHYLGLCVKHNENSHVDFTFNGIYTCNNELLKKFVIRGPVENLSTLIKRCIDRDSYVIINVNERYLPNREAYDKSDFYHDLLIFGYDEQTKYFLTLGFDKNMKFCKYSYHFKEIEKAYYYMKDEWNYEFFIFHFNDEYTEFIDKKKIANHLEEYCNGVNTNGKYINLFLENLENSIEYVSNSYYESYGINVYDYLIERLSQESSRINFSQEGGKLGITDLRSLNVLKAHIKIIAQMMEDIMTEKPLSEIQESLKYIESNLSGINLLVMQYFASGEKKFCRRAKKLLVQSKKEELAVCRHMINELRDSY